MIETIEILRIGKDAKEFDAVSAFVTPIEEMEAKKDKEMEDFKNKMNSIEDSLTETESGLKYIITQENPDGIQPQSGQKVSVHYAGRLSDGTLFDSSYKRGQPLQFPVGVGQVIPGWDEGIQLLKTGEKATLVIPADLAYGARGAGGVIPPNATLVFDVELIDVQ